MKKKAPPSWQKELDRILLKLGKASVEAAGLSSAERKKLLLEAAREIEKNSARIQRENKKDLDQAVKTGLSSALVDRLRLDGSRIRQMAQGVRSVAALPDPIGRVLSRWKRPNGLRISRVSVPIGVILIIFESRPNVTVECASLCLKSGNAVLLRGGKEAFYSNQALASIFANVLKRHGRTPACVSMLKTTDRTAVDYLLSRDQDIHLVIPRGGESLIRKVVELSRIPVIKHYQGICHVYIDEFASVEKAVSIALNAKMQRTGVCNAMETLLVHKKAAGKVLPKLGAALVEAGCEIRADAAARQWIPSAKAARKDDFGKEFLDKILAVKVVGSVEEAAEHIRRHGSGHTEAIVTANRARAKWFVDHVDSSSVMVNASTRFADGFEYGLGAEIGISTDKIHARGPMGLEGLTSYKYVVEGHGQIRS